MQNVTSSAGTVQRLKRAANAATSNVEATVPSQTIGATVAERCARYAAAATHVRAPLILFAPPQTAATARGVVRKCKIRFTSTRWYGRNSSARPRKLETDMLRRSGQLWRQSRA
eukprot:scaffold1541_cov256-Pinguiococcus_pyrenoidosus.AAC.23